MSAVDRPVEMSVIALKNDHKHHATYLIVKRLSNSIAFAHEPNDPPGNQYR